MLCEQHYNTNLKFNVCFGECNKVSFKCCALLVVNFLLSTMSSVRKLEKIYLGVLSFQAEKTICKLNSLVSSSSLEQVHTAKSVPLVD